MREDCVVKVIKTPICDFTVSTFGYVFKLEYQNKTEFFPTIEQSEARANEFVLDKHKEIEEFIKENNIK